MKIGFAVGIAAASFFFGKGFLSFAKKKDIAESPTGFEIFVFLKNFKTGTAQKKISLLIKV